MKGKKPSNIMTEQKSGHNKPTVRQILLKSYHN